MSLRSLFHLLLALPALSGVSLVILLAFKSTASDTSERSFFSLAGEAWADVAKEIPASAPAEYEESEEETDSIESLPPALADKFARNNAFVASCSLLIVLGIIGIGMVGGGVTRGEPWWHPLLRTGAIAAFAYFAFLLWGFSMAFPGEFNGFVSLPVPTLPGGIDSVEYGLGGMSEWTDLFTIASYAAVGGCLVVSLACARIRASLVFLVATPVAAVILPVVISWTWGAGWLDHLQNNGDFAGGALIHWHVGTIALLIGGIATPFLRRSDTRTNQKDSHPAFTRILFLCIGFPLYFLGILGMNASSVLAATPGLVAAIVQCTLLAAAASALCALVWWAVFRTRTILEFLGIASVAGAVSVSAGADYMGMSSAIILGVLTGLLVPGIVVVLDKVKWPDPLAVGPVHGIAGGLGVLAAGFFPSEDSLATFPGQLILLVTVPLLSLLLALFVTAVFASIGYFIVKPRPQAPPLPSSRPA